MELFGLLNTLEHEVVQGTIRRKIGKVTNDSRNIEAEDVFVCIKGYRQDGHDKIPEALQNGAGTIVVERKIQETIPCDITIIMVPDTRYALAVLSAAQYEYPAESLKIIGVTGTKGKSTVACMIHQILNGLGHKTGLIGTIQVDTGAQIYKAANTTPESLELQKYLKEMVEENCEYVVMEVSSQGLKLHRTAGISFEVGIFTNMGIDHISPTEHKDFEEYLSCKKKLFHQCKAGVGNIDDPYYEEVFSDTAYPKITYSIKNTEADYFAEDIHKIKTNQRLGCEYVYREGRKKYKIELPIPGEFNIYNSLAVIAVLRKLGITNEEIILGMQQVKIPGRLEKIEGIYDCMLYIDYAHNGMSLKKVLQMFRSYEPERMVVIFGCGGDRAKDRRYDMGRVAGEYADLTIITTDNPRYESPAQIIKDIEKGIKKTKGIYQIIPDRKQAIRYAIENRKSGDVILIAGKGHETYQEIKGIRYKMDDRQLIAAIIQEMNN